MIWMERSVAAVATIPARSAGVDRRRDDVVTHRAEVRRRGGEDLDLRHPVVLGGKGNARGDGSGGRLGDMEDSGGERRLAVGAERDVADEVSEPRRGHVAVFVYFRGCSLARGRGPDDAPDDPSDQLGSHGDDRSELSGLVKGSKPLDANWILFMSGRERSLLIETI